jgi:molybdenum cofactor cytidylyltransferase
MISAVILAAGKSERMGKAKLFLPFNKQTVIEEVIDQVKASQVYHIRLVYGDWEDKWRRIAEKKGIPIIHNPDYQQGQSTSVRVGVRSLPDEAEGIIFILGDQPLIKSEVIDRLINIFYLCRPSIVAPIYQGKRGNPVLFHRKWREELLALSGDRGAREILQQHSHEVLKVYFAEGIYNMDIDTEEDYQRLLFYATSH